MTKRSGDINSASVRRYNRLVKQGASLLEANASPVIENAITRVERGERQGRPLTEAGKPFYELTDADKRNPRISMTWQTIMRAGSMLSTANSLRDHSDLSSDVTRQLSQVAMGTEFPELPLPPLPPMEELESEGLDETTA